MKRSLLIAIALLVLVLAGTAGFALARGRYFGAPLPLLPAAASPELHREPMMPRWGPRRALEGTIVAWEANQAVLEAQTAKYTVLISQHTRIVRRTAQPLGARAIVLGRTQDASINAYVVILLPPEPKLRP